MKDIENIVDTIYSMFIFTLLYIFNTGYSYKEVATFSVECDKLDEDEEEWYDNQPYEVVRNICEEHTELDNIKMSLNNKICLIMSIVQVVFLMIIVVMSFIYSFNVMFIPCLCLSIIIILFGLYYMCGGRRAIPDFMSFYSHPKDRNLILMKCLIMNLNYSSFKVAMVIAMRRVTVLFFLCLLITLIVM